jgi:hypothetical protein
MTSLICLWNHHTYAICFAAHTANCRLHVPVLLCGSCERHYLAVCHLTTDLSIFDICAIAAPHLCNHA